MLPPFDIESRSMRLIVGLGNPGQEYEHTRHNAGFDTIARLADELGARYWKNECGALTAKVSYKGQDLVLAMPQSYMNTSGGPVKQLCSTYKLSAADIVVIHDELDIDPGTIRVKHGGGLAGHNGLKSIAEKMQTKDWTRIRIGIGRPSGRMSVVDWVLGVPKKEAMEDFQAACDLGTQAILFYLDNGLDKTQQRFN